MTDRLATMPRPATGSIEPHRHAQIRNRLLNDAVETLNKRRAKEGKALLPHVTPHVDV